MKETAQFYKASQLPTDKRPTSDTVVPKDVLRVFQDAIVAHGPTKPCPPRLDIKPEKMITNIILIAKTKAADEQIL